jgi:hypothetical protein
VIVGCCAGRKNGGPKTAANSISSFAGAQHYGPGQTCVSSLRREYRPFADVGLTAAIILMRTMSEWTG